MTPRRRQPAPELSGRDRALLRFAAHHQGASLDVLIPAARSAFGLSYVSYLQALLVAIRQPGAAALEPVLVNRPTRLLAARADRRRRAEEASERARTHPHERT